MSWWAGLSMSPTKKPKLSVAASTMKKPKMTFSRFMVLLRQRVHAKRQRRNYALSASVVDGAIDVAVHVAVHVIPAPVLAHEAAGLVQALGPAADPVAGEELDLGMVLIERAVRPDLQADPLRGWRFVELERGRARAGVPACQQVGGVAKRKGGVARAHQRFGGGGGAFAGQGGAAALREPASGAARAGGVRFHAGSVYPPADCLACDAPKRDA